MTPFFGSPLYLAGAGVGGVFLGHGGHGGMVDALVAFDHVLREEATGVELWEAQRQLADDGGEAALPVAVSAFCPAAARSVSASIAKFATYSASLRISACMSMAPSSNWAWRAYPASGLIRFL